MKKLTTLLVLGPGSAFAHGGHVELAGSAHDSFHAAPLIGVALIVVVIGHAALRRRG
ncbi:MAG: hypothetical protein QNJ20_18055 [Paracoccaceae bacterium]|nr:hypothetical protein [Paracoccaceae bacterium]